MGGKSTSETNSRSSTVQNPYAPTIAPIHQVASGVGQLLQDGYTPEMAAQYNALRTNAAAGNPAAGQIRNLATDLLGGGTDRTPFANQTFENLQNGLLPYATGQHVDPYANPAFLKVMEDLQRRTANQVNSTWAASGRDTSPGNARALGEGIASAMAPHALDWFNKQQANQIGALNTIFNAGNTTAGLLSNFDQTALANRQAGVNVAQQALQAENYTPTTLLQIAQMEQQARQQPYSWATGILQPLAQTGGTSSSESQSKTTTSSGNPMQQILGAAMMGAGLLTGNPMLGMSAGGLFGGGGLFGSGAANPGVAGGGYLGPGGVIYPGPGNYR